MAIYGNPLGSGLGAERQAYLNKAMLTNISQMTRYDKLATITKPLPSKNTKVQLFDKWIPSKVLYFLNNINEDFTGNDPTIGEETLLMVPRDAYQEFALDEGSSGTSKARMELIQTSAEVFPIGDWMPYTPELEMFHERWTTTEAVNQMSETAAMILDGFYRDLYAYNAGHLYDISGDGTGSDSVVDAAFTNANKKLVTALKYSGAGPIKRLLSSSPNYGTVPVDLQYVAYGAIAAIDAMEANPDFVPVEQYTTNPLEGERGKIKNVRYVEDANSYIEEVSSGIYVADFTISGGDHTAQIPVRGKSGVQVHTKSIGSGGTSDPLDRIGTIGWSIWLGAKVLYPERLGIIRARFNY